MNRIWCWLQSIGLWGFAVIALLVSLFAVMDKAELNKQITAAKSWIPNIPSIGATPTVTTAWVVTRSNPGCTFGPPCRNIISKTIDDTTFDVIYVRTGVDGNKHTYHFHAEKNPSDEWWVGRWDEEGCFGPFRIHRSNMPDFYVGFWKIDPTVDVPVEQERFKTTEGGFDLHLAYVTD